MLTAALLMTPSHLKAKPPQMDGKSLVPLLLDEARVHELAPSTQHHLGQYSAHSPTATGLPPRSIRTLYAVARFGLKAQICACAI